MAWYWYIYHVVALWCMWGFVRGIIKGIKELREEEKKANSSNKEEE